MDPRSADAPGTEDGSVPRSCLSELELTEIRNAPSALQEKESGGGWGAMYALDREGTRTGNARADAAAALQIERAGVEVVVDAGVAAPIVAPATIEGRARKELRVLGRARPIDALDAIWVETLRVARAHIVSAAFGIGCACDRAYLWCLRAITEPLRWVVTILAAGENRRAVTAAGVRRVKTDVTPWTVVVGAAFAFFWRVTETDLFARAAGASFLRADIVEHAGEAPEIAATAHAIRKVGDLFAVTVAATFAAFLAGVQAALQAVRAARIVTRSAASRVTRTADIDDLVALPLIAARFAATGLPQLDGTAPCRIGGACLERGRAPAFALAADLSGAAGMLHTLTALTGGEAGLVGYRAIARITAAARAKIGAIVAVGATAATGLVGLTADIVAIGAARADLT